MEAVKNSRFMDGVCLDVEKLDEDQKNKLRDSVHQDIWIEGVYSEKSQAPYGYSSGTFYVERIFNSMKSKK